MMIIFLCGVFLSFYIVLLVAFCVYAHCVDREIEAIAGISDIARKRINALEDRTQVLEDASTEAFTDQKLDLWIASLQQN